MRHAPPGGVPQVLTYVLAGHVAADLSRVMPFDVKSHSPARGRRNVPAVERGSRRRAPKAQAGRLGCVCKWQKNSYVRAERRVSVCESCYSLGKALGMHVDPANLF